MIYFVVILMVIVGISFIVWYSNKQGIIHETPVRPFLKDVSKIKKVEKLDENKDLVQEILTLVADRYRGTCDIGYQNEVLRIYGLSIVCKTSEVNEVCISYNKKEFRLTLTTNRGMYSKDELVQVLQVLKLGVKKYKIDTLIVTHIPSEWFFNSRIYINMGTYEHVIFGEFKVCFNYKLFKEFYTKEELDQFKPSEDPRKIHWKEFLDAEMKSKKQREVDCHNYVNEVLQKQVEYNDLQINYQMLPSAPITDVESFRNFCKVVHEDTKYEDYEIQNYLLLKKSMQ